MHTTHLLSGLSASMAALLLSAGSAGAATLPFARDCDPIPADPVSSTKPAVEPWYLTFEQRGAGGACVLADIFTNSSLTNKLAVGDEVRTLRFSGYDIDFVEDGDSNRPLLASSSAIDDGYLLADGSSAISARLGNGSDKFNVLAFRFQLGTASEIRTTVTFRSGASTTLEPIGGTGSFFQSRFFSFGDQRIAQVDWQAVGGPSDPMRLDTLTFSTTVTDPGGGGGDGGGDGGGGSVPEPSSLALLALAGGVAAFRRRRADD